MSTLGDARSQRMLERRRREWDEHGHDDSYVMYRRSDGTPEAPEAQRAVAEQVAALLAVGPEETLLDVGCGAGALTRELRPYFRQVTATDLSEAMLERARRVLPDVPLHVAPAHDLPFADATFSRALCYGVFLLFPDYDYVEQAFAEILRVVQPGGVVVLGDMPDAAKKRLSYEWRVRWHASPVKTTLRSWRDALADALVKPRPRGFFRMSYFQHLASAAGHSLEIVPETSAVERSGWRVNLVIHKAG